MNRRRALSREQILRMLDLEDPVNHDSDVSFSPQESDISSESEEETVPVPHPVVASRSRSTSQQITRGRGGTRTSRNRGGARGCGSTDDNNGWLEPPNPFGLISEEDIPTYTGVSGMTVPLPTDRTPLGYFTLFVDNVVIDRFVLETNKFAKQVKEHLPDFYYLKRWDCDTGTDSTEMRKLIGILMAMGVVSKPTERSYWSTNSIMETPFFNKVMPRDRFLALFTFWHLNDNEEAPLPGSPDYDKLYKIQPFFSHLQERFSSVYYPEENMAVDESVMPWRGRVAWRQFIANKPCRYGMKLYCLYESSSGYIVKMKMYTGKDGNKREVDHGTNVVKALTEDYRNKGHTIFTDSFFTSSDLVTYMQENGTSYVGTVPKHRRGNPTDISSKDMKLAKGKTVVRQKNNVIAVRYNDRKDFMLLSSKFTAEPVDTGKTVRLTREQRQRGEKARNAVKPMLVHEYNKSMNGVDHFDQHLSYYSFNRKTVKWWKRAATHLLHMALVQAMILFNKYEDKPKPQADFVLDLVMQLTNCGVAERQDPADPHAERQDGEILAGDDEGQGNDEAAAGEVEAAAGGVEAEEPPKKRMRVKPMDFERLSHADNPHRLVPNPPTAKRMRAVRNCECCTIASGKRLTYLRRVQTSYMCNACKVPLCPDPCFSIYHSTKDYKREMRRYYSINGEGE
ncbi:piggyBac transposable element-derived protein 4-like isoform X1 [Littorina saxatilis]